MILVIFFVKCLFEPNFVISIYVVTVLQMSKVCKKKDSTFKLQSIYLSIHCTSHHAFFTGSRFSTCFPIFQRSGKPQQSCSPTPNGFNKEPSPEVALTTTKPTMHFYSGGKMRGIQQIINCCTPEPLLLLLLSVAS